MSFELGTMNKDSQIPTSPAMSNQECDDLLPANMPSSEATESEAAKSNSASSPIRHCDIPIQSLEDDETMDNMVNNSASYNIFGEPVDSDMHCDTIYEPSVVDQSYNSEDPHDAVMRDLSETISLEMESEIDAAAREVFASLDKQDDSSISHRNSDEYNSGDTVVSEQSSDFSSLSSMSQGGTPESESADTAATESEPWAHIADNWKNTFGIVPAAVEEAQQLVHSFRNTKKRPLENENPTPSASNPVSNKRLKRFEAITPSGSVTMLENSPPPSEDGQTTLSQPATTADKILEIMGKTMPLAHNVMGDALTPPASDDGHASNCSAKSDDLCLIKSSSMYSRKFQMPYQPGWQFVVHAHIPPKPTPVIDECLRMDDEGRFERDKLPSRQRFQKHPPLQGLMGNNSLKLQIQKPVRTGLGYQAQVFTVTPSPCELSCNKDGSSPQSASPVQLVAKVFDPLYLEYPGELEDSLSHTPGSDSYLTEMNPFKAMDQFYTHEAQAYQKLADFQGRGIPYYFGSYSLSLPLSSNESETATRDCRLILVQQIEGVPMSKLDPEDISQQARQRVIRSIIELECKIYQRDIELADLAPRNVMLIGDVENNPGVVFIDFGDVLFGRFQEDSGLEDHEKYLGNYMSPLIHWWKEVDEFRRWIDWEWYPWIVQEFDDTKNTITPKMWEDFSVARLIYEKCTGTKVL